MKKLIILSLFCFEAFALDSFSVSRRLGTEGERGTQILQLICADEKCLITSGIDDKTSEKKEISKAQADEIFKAAKASMPKSVLNKNYTHSFTLEKDNKKIEVQAPEAALLKIEYKLQQLVAP